MRNGEEDDQKEMFDYSPGYDDDELMNMENGDQTATSKSSMEDYSRTCSSSSDLVDDASSSSTSILSTNCKGPLYELSQLMAQLPIKRGLSKYFEGKSQSFTCLTSVKNIQDFAKKETRYKKKMKACKRYGGGLMGDTHKLYTLPKPTISKKVSRNSMPAALCFAAKTSCSRPPLSHLQRNNFSSV
ncbi:protein OXIDATIVE STRESS 3-like isoform X2 [Gossypium arboreum]|nr:protein OXIDATIVE STRESS 3-like isoform X2 [Gossypium arboreum]